MITIKKEFILTESEYKKLNEILKYYNYNHNLSRTQSDIINIMIIETYYNLIKDSKEFREGKYKNE